LRNKLRVFQFVGTGLTNSQFYNEERPLRQPEQTVTLTSRRR